MRKIMAAVMAAVMSISLSLTSPVTISDAAVPQIIAQEDNNVGESGNCGQNAKWELSGGKLTVTGTGKMVSWATSDKVPWSKLRSQITSVDIGDGITSIGSYAFTGCANLGSVKIGSSVTDIEMNVFFGCPALGSVELPASVSTLGRDSLKNCSSLRSVTINNSKCRIVGTSETISNSSSGGKGTYNGTIFGYASSTAATYAKKYSYNFQQLSGQPPVITTTTAQKTTTTTKATTTTTTTKKTTTTTSTTKAASTSSKSTTTRRSCCGSATPASRWASARLTRCCPRFTTAG